MAIRAQLLQMCMAYCGHEIVPNMWIEEGPNGWQHQTCPDEEPRGRSQRARSRIAAENTRLDRVAAEEALGAREAQERAIADEKAQRDERSAVLRARADDARASIAESISIAGRVRERLRSLPSLPPDPADIRKKRVYQRGNRLVIRGIAVPIEYAVDDATGWVRTGRPDDISTFRLTDRRARFAYLKLLQALDI